MIIIFVILFDFIAYKANIINAEAFSQNKFENWDKMNVLSDTIFERMKTPSGNGLDLIEDVHSYYEFLEHLQSAAEKNESRAVNFLYSLREKGGPRHLLIHPVDPEPLVKFFKWDQFATSQFAGFLEYSFNIWRDLQTYLEMKDTKQNWANVNFEMQEADSFMFE